MASSLTAASLTITHTESLTLNGVNYGGTNTQTIASIAEVSKRIVKIPTTEQILVNFSEKIAAGTYVSGNVRYLRMTNLDNANFLYLVFKNEYLNEFCVKLDKGQTFIYNPDLASGMIDTMLANQVPLGFTETTGDLATGSDDVTGINATNKIIPGLRISSPATPSGATVGATTPGYSSSDGYQATSHTMVTRHATTGAETAANATGNEDNDQDYAAGFGDLTSITAEADTASIDLEMFLALV